MNGKVEKTIYVPVILHENFEIPFGNSDIAEGSTLAFQKYQDAEKSIEKARKQKNLKDGVFSILIYKRAN